eukprot:507382_1
MLDVQIHLIVIFIYICHWINNICKFISLSPSTGILTAESLSPTTAYPTYATLISTTTIPTSITSEPTKRIQSAMLITSVITMDTSISTGNKVNLIGDIINRQSKRKYVYESIYKWMGKNGKLTNEQIEHFQQTSLSK